MQCNCCQSLIKHDSKAGHVNDQLFGRLEETFPDADHTLLNRAIPAVTSGYVSACVPELVPDNADLVLLEFTYNDHVFSGGNRNVNDASRCCLLGAKARQEQVPYAGPHISHVNTQEGCRTHAMGLSAM